MEDMYKGGGGQMKALADELIETKKQLNKFLALAHSQERLGAKLANHIASQGVTNERVRMYLSTMTNEELLRVFGI